jgi:Tol biopolymer transport system component
MSCSKGCFEIIRWRLSIATTSLLLRVLTVVLVVGASCTAVAEPLRLTHDGRLKRAPRFVDGGTQIVYSVVEGPTIVRQVKLNIASGEIAAMYPDASTSQFESTFSPDGRYHAFVEFRAVTNVKLVIRDTRAGSDVVFDPGSDRAHLGNPVFDPRGGRIVFSLPRTAGQQLVSINVQAQDLRRLTSQSEAIDDWAAFSPDGSRIAFGSSREGDFEIFVMHSDGSRVRRLTESPGADMRPAWSPDGRSIAFTSARDGNYEIYAISADGSGQPRRITNHEERDDFAQWHPDGRHLLTIAERGGDFDLYLTDVSGL